MQREPIHAYSYISVTSTLLMNFDEWLTNANILKQVLSYAHLFTVFARLNKTGVYWAVLDSSLFLLDAHLYLYGEQQGD